jgi:hypothetical protein
VGLNMWLPSVFDFSDERKVQCIFDDIDSAGTGEDPLGFATRIYDALRATGGYYREAYNGHGLLAVIGMSWTEILNSLGDPSLLPPCRARDLLAELEARPITYPMVRGQCRNDRDARLVRVLEAACALAPQPQPNKDRYSDLDCGEVYGHYVARRNQLMALLRTAIERDEPLCVG